MFKSKLNFVYRCLHHSYTFALFACLLYGLVSQNRICPKLFLGGNKKVFVGRYRLKTARHKRKWEKHFANLLIYSLRSNNHHPYRASSSWQLKQVQIYSRLIRWMRKRLDNGKRSEKLETKPSKDKNFDFPSFQFSNLILLNLLRLNCEIHLRIHFHFCNEA